MLSQWDLLHILLAVIVGNILVNIFWLMFGDLIFGGGRQEDGHR